MRATALAAVAALFAASPALAQVTPADISPTAERDFWCAAAFGMLSYTLKTTGDQTGSDEADTSMQTLFAGIAIDMQAKGMDRGDYDALVTEYTAKAMNPFSERAYEREECDAAVVEARTTHPMPPDVAPPADGGEDAGSGAEAPANPAQ